MAANRHPSYAIIACINLLLNLVFSQLQVIRVYSSVLQLSEDKFATVCVIVIGIFVDDLLVAGNSVAEIKEVRERMNQRFVLSDKGTLEYYLGVEISSLDENTLLLHQTAYAKKILNYFKMNDYNPAKTPLPRDVNILPRDYVCWTLQMKAILNCRASTGLSSDL
jgi:hypothetical protein